MGNLHKGHLALIRHAKLFNGKVVCSIFVNALQFDCQEDLNAYPRTLQQDLSALRNAGVDAVFVPDNDEIYAKQNESRKILPRYNLSYELCGKFRPGFFDGIIEVVERLFEIVTPDIAVFGEKDYQQLVIIKKLVADLELPIQIEQVATQREDSGLAYSSRNSYLSKTDRIFAPRLYEELLNLKNLVLNGEKDYKLLEKRAMENLKMEGLSPDYVAVRDGENLEIPSYDTDFLVVLGAAWISNARLIDNVLLHIT